MDIQIINYSEKYFEQVATLFDEFQGFIAWIDPKKGNVWKKGFGEVAIKETIEEVKKNEGALLLAMGGEKVAGFIAGVVKHPTEIEHYTSAHPEDDEGRITELYLSGEYQHQGLGRKLVEAMEDFFRKKGIKVVRVEVFAPNENARKFYQKMGFEERSLDLIKEI